MRKTAASWGMRLATPLVSERLVVTFPFTEGLCYSTHVVTTWFLSPFAAITFLPFYQSFPNIIMIHFLLHFFFFSSSFISNSFLYHVIRFKKNLIKQYLSRTMLTAEQKSNLNISWQNIRTLRVETSYIDSLYTIDRKYGPQVMVQS